MWNSWNPHKSKSPEAAFHDLFRAAATGACTPKSGWRIVGFDGVAALDLTGPFEAMASARRVGELNGRSICYRPILLGVTSRTFVSESGLPFKAEGVRGFGGSARYNHRPGRKRPASTGDDGPRCGPGWSSALARPGELRPFPPVSMRSRRAACSTVVMSPPIGALPVMSRGDAFQSCAIMLAAAFRKDGEVLYLRRR